MREAAASIYLNELIIIMHAAETEIMLSHVCFMATIILFGCARAVRRAHSDFRIILSLYATLC